MPPHGKTNPSSSPARSMWRHVDGRKGRGESNLSKANMSWTEADDGRETNKQKKTNKTL